METGNWSRESGVRSQEGEHLSFVTLVAHITAARDRLPSISQISTNQPSTFISHRARPSTLQALAAVQNWWSGVSTLLHETADNSGRPMFPKLRFCNPRARQLLTTAS
jgi:hypothetical protein